VRTQKLMWRNIMKSTKSQKASVLHYSIDGLVVDLRFLGWSRRCFGFLVHEGR
jgi:hypothetical protein